MSKMSRRQSCFPKIILPALRRPSPTVAIIGDTTGSMDNKALGRAQAEVKGILKSTGAINDTLFLSVDAEVHNAKKIVKSSQIKFYGGGGTDMRVGFEYLKEKKIRPNVVVVFTDAFTPWPKVEYPWKTIVIVIGDGNTSEIPKSYKVIRVAD
jgi:predicted metal-dependent peptidase